MMSRITSAPRPSVTRRTASTKSSVGVVDRCASAPSSRSRSCLAARAVVTTVAPSAAPSWMANVPMPLPPPCTSSVSPLAAAGPARPRWTRPCRRPRAARRRRPGRRRPGPAAAARPARRPARRSRRRPAARTPRRPPASRSRPAPTALITAGALQPRVRRRAGRRRVVPLPLQQVGPVDRAGRARRRAPRRGRARDRAPRPRPARRVRRAPGS